MSIPVVPLSAFTNLAGVALAGDLRRLLADPALSGLVLFSDTLGEQLALLPLGAGQPHQHPASVAGLEIEGLRPLCALHLRGAGWDVDETDERKRELARREQDLQARERALSEREARLEVAERRARTAAPGFLGLPGRRGGEVAETGVGNRSFAQTSN